MKSKITALFIAVIVSGCAIVPTSITGGNGQQAYKMYCSSGIDKCYQKSAELCPNGYDVIELSKESSELIVHYGEHPKTIYKEYLTIECDK